MPDTHARFSPSAANRRIHCPPSLLLEEQFEEGESVYAAEGTAGHALAEHLIRKYLKQRTTRPTSEYYKDELLEAVDEYVSFVIGEIEDARRECQSPVLLVEQRIDASEYVDSCFGTADMVIITDKVAHVIDLKLGKGVEVHAEENPQLMIYGLGVLHMAEALYDIETVRMTIFQPRLGNSSTWSVSPEYLKHWGNEVLRRRLSAQAISPLAHGAASVVPGTSAAPVRKAIWHWPRWISVSPRYCPTRRFPRSSPRRTSSPNGRQTCTPLHRMRRSTTVRRGLASRWSKAVASASTRTKPTWYRLQPLPVIRIFTRKP